MLQVMAELAKEGTFSNPIVTQLRPYDASNYYTAEGYHQNYWNLNPGQGYCQFVVEPKARCCYGSTGIVFLDFYLCCALCVFLQLSNPGQGYCKFVVEPKARQHDILVQWLAFVVWKSYIWKCFTMGRGTASSWWNPALQRHWRFVMPFPPLLGELGAPIGGATALLSRSAFSFSRHLVIIHYSP